MSEAEMMPAANTAGGSSEPLAPARRVVLFADGGMLDGTPEHVRQGLHALDEMHGDDAYTSGPCALPEQGDNCVAQMPDLPAGWPAPEVVVHRTVTIPEGETPCVIGFDGITFYTQESLAAYLESLNAGHATPLPNGPQQSGEVYDAR